MNGDSTMLVLKVPLDPHDKMLTLSSCTTLTLLAMQEDIVSMSKRLKDSVPRKI